MYKLNSDDGTLAGLFTWAVFVLVFFLLGTPAVLSILLGLLGGIAVGTMIAYARAEKLDDEPKAQEPKSDAIRPVQRIVNQLPVSRFRPKLPSPLRPKSPRRIGRPK
jgi:hypothetical protein